MTNLTVLSTAIRQDKDGRYCLNDCHKASGGDAAKKPANFLRLDTTKALIAEISRCSDVSNAPVNVKQGGNDQGSYACRELIYAYGEWISPAFHLTVIRAFDALVMGKATPKPKRVRKPAVDVAFRRCKNIADMLPNFDENQRLLMAARGTFNMTGTNPLELLGVPALEAPSNEHYFTPTELGSKRGVSGMKMNTMLAAAGLQRKEASGWVMTERGQRYGRIFDTTRRGGKGSQAQLKWKESVLDLI